MVIFSENDQPEYLDSASLLHVRVLENEIDHLKTLIRPHDTGHIHTTINTLEWRLRVIKGNEN